MPDADLVIKPWQLIALLSVGCVAFFIARHVGGDPGQRQPAAGPSGSGPIWVLHYKPASAGRVVYEDIVRALPAEDRLVIVAQDEAGREDARRILPGRAMRVLTVDAHLSPWARDRGIFYRQQGERVCLAPLPSTLPERQRGDAAVPDRLEQAGMLARVIRSAVAPVGGDTILMPDRALVGHDSFARARQTPGQLEDGVVKTLAGLLGRPVMVVPTHELGIERLHLDMLVGHAGGKRLVVGDPRLAAQAFTGARWEHASFGSFDRARNASIARGTDQVVRYLTTSGYTVERVPMLVSEAGPRGRPPVVLTWSNAVTRGSVVHLPAYGLEALDRAAARIWRGLGYEVVSIRCHESILVGGAVRCLLNRIPE